MRRPADLHAGPAQGPDGLPADSLCELHRSENANLIPAYGTALSASDAPSISFDQLMEKLESTPRVSVRTDDVLPPIFQSPEDYAAWKKAKEADFIQLTPLTADTDEVYVGIDSGSTTTKLVVTNPKDEILFTHYGPNNGNPIGAVQKAFEAFYAECLKVGANPKILGSCSTGYGEDLIKAAFGLRTGIIETIAHYLAARKSTRMFPSSWISADRI